MSGVAYSADYGKRLSSCKKCKKQLEKGGIRLAKVTPNPFSSDGGDMKSYFHPECMFESFSRARATTKVIETAADVEGWSDLSKEDKEKLVELMEDLEKKRENKGKKASPKKTSPAKPDQPKIDQLLAGGATSSSKKAEASDSDDSVTDPPDPKPESGKKDDSWYAFCNLCENIAKTSKYTAKTAVIERFIKKGSSGEGYNGDVYTLCKLLIPKTDQRVYNVKEKALIKVFSEIFGEDADKMTDHFNTCGEVAVTLKEYYGKSSKRTPCKRSTLSIHDVDRWLTDLTNYTKEAEQQRHFLKLIKTATTIDLMYVLRLVKKDLRINAGVKHVLDALAPNAYEAFQASRNLKQVIQKVQQRNDAPAGMKKALSIGIQLGTAVLPMLAEACKSVEYAMKKCPNGMFAEIKYDGERVQVHKNGEKFHYYSRSLKPVTDHKVQHFSKFIPKAFPGGGDIILDSEVLLIDTNTGKPLPFGTLGKHKKQAFSDANVCLFVFDCLLYQGKSLMQKPVEERRKFLQDNMKEIPNRIMISDMEYIAHGNNKKLSGMIHKAIDEGLEGLVLKDVKSLYEPGKRHWLKVKKDYLEEGAMADTADLLVLGGFFGTGNKGGIMSVFLMGVEDKKSGKFLTVTKCGNGHDDATLDKINKELQKNMKKINRDAEKLPSWIRCNRSLVPDFIAIDPKKVPVWEITGAEFSESSNHTADGISIRFPRVTKIRNDKDWEGATNLDELKKLYETSKEKPDIDDKSPKKAGLKRSLDVKSEDPPLPIKLQKEDSLSKKMEQWEVIDNPSEKKTNESEKKRDKSPVEKKTESRKNKESRTKEMKKSKHRSSSSEGSLSSTEPESGSDKNVEDWDEDGSPAPKRKTRGTTKQACRYGAKCYQKNPEHRKKFSHPKKYNEDSDEDDAGSGAKEPKLQISKETVKKEEREPNSPQKLPSLSKPKTVSIKKESSAEKSSTSVEKSAPGNQEIFEGLKIYINPEIEDAKKLKRYVAFYCGDLIDFSQIQDATHCITSKKESFYPEECLILKPEWLTNSIKNKILAPVDEFNLP